MKIAGISSEAIRRTWQSINDSFDGCIHIESAYSEAAARCEGLKEWELDISQYCKIFANYLPFKGKNEIADETLEYAANFIGHLIAKQLIEGNVAAPRIVSEGIINLMSGGKFRKRCGRSSSNLKELILYAFAILDFSAVKESPSQIEVQDYIRQHGLEVPADRMSKIFSETGLDKLSSDARAAASKSGRRKRKTS